MTFQVRMIVLVLLLVTHWLTSSSLKNPVSISKQRSSESVNRLELGEAQRVQPCQGWAVMKGCFTIKATGL